jgi:hypothetical protein
MKKQIQIIQILILLLVLLSPILLLAQPLDKSLRCWWFEPESAPIDGGLSLLLAAGIGYGAKKLHQNRKVLA